MHPVLWRLRLCWCQGWPSTSQGTPAPCPGCQEEVPGVHIPAHTGKRPHRSLSSARQSSPHYWARQVLGSCSSPPLEKTDRQKGEWTSPAGQCTHRLRAMLAVRRSWAFSACFSTLSPSQSTGRIYLAQWFPRIQLLRTGGHCPIGNSGGPPASWASQKALGAAHPWFQAPRPVSMGSSHITPAPVSPFSSP